MKLSLIVAMDSNRVIGRNKALPWYLPEDLKLFKRVTMGKPLIMGRKTFESIGKPLPGRTNIVISRDPEYRSEGVKVVRDLDAAMQLCEHIAEIEGGDEVMVIGGAEVYKLALPRADRLYLTQVHAEVEGDTLFPEFDRSAWQELSREDFKAVGPNPYAYSFLILERASHAP